MYFIYVDSSPSPLFPLPNLFSFYLSPPPSLPSPLFLEQRSRPTGSCKFLSVKWIISQKIGVAFTQMVSFSFNQCVVFSYMVSIQPSCNFFSNGDILIIFGYVIQNHKNSSFSKMGNYRTNSKKVCNKGLSQFSSPSLQTVRSLDHFCLKATYNTSPT